MTKRTVVVTGAGSGIGKACARAFAGVGYRVVLAGRNYPKIEALANEFRQEGKQALAVRCDVSVEDDCRNLIQQAVNEFGAIDVLLNNAGISMRALFADTDLEVLRTLMNTNFWGTVYCTKFALPYLLKSRGSVVGVSSIAGKKGLPGRTGYSASKFAMEGFLETLRTENLKKGLHVLVACPGFTASEIRNTALSADGSVQGESPRDEKSMMSAEEVARYILKAVEHRKRDLVLTLQGRLTVWLNNFFPSWSDKLVYKHMSKEPGSPFK